MISLLLSIKPKWLVKILKGEKTLEIRKSFPQCDYPVTVYLYCTRDRSDKEALEELRRIYGRTQRHEPFGKVVAKFTLNKAEPIKLVKVNDYSYNTYEWATETLTEEELSSKSCLLSVELNHYLQNKIGYAWYIDNLEVLKTPRYLNEGFFQPKKKPDQIFIQTYRNPPQSWCYVLYRKGYNNDRRNYSR